MSEPSLVWFRQDLRLSDNPALAAAVARGGPVIPVYIWAPEEEGKWPPGGASKWWLAQSLCDLAARLKERGSRLIVCKEASEGALKRLANETGATAVFWNRRYEPAAIARDKQVKSSLRERGVMAESCNGSLLFEPWTMRNQSGNPFLVFTPFWKACLAKRLAPAPADVPRRWHSPSKWPHSLALADLELEPKIDWAEGLREAWKPGEAGAAHELKRFVQKALERYPTDRDRPDRVGTSRLSPHLHHGEISPGEVWRAVFELRDEHPTACQTYLRELGWREFAYHLLYHHPETTDKPLRPEFARFPWKTNAKWLKAWQRGRTGYPLVDAGMQELWRTGWMHNRVRLVAGSFLVKHLLHAWQEGADWFWDTLVDADLANNSLNWQWVGGCGADAAPYFRIFNPTIQAKKFDPDGAYARKWAGEGIEPIVDHSEARERALEAFASIRNK